MLPELRTGLFTREPWKTITVSESKDPNITMRGLHIIPDMIMSDLDPADSDLLIIFGGEIWDRGEGVVWVETASGCLDTGIPVAAIGGETPRLATAGLLDNRLHTSAAYKYLHLLIGYRGGNKLETARKVEEAEKLAAAQKLETVQKLAAAQKLEVVEKPEAVNRLATALKQGSNY